ncbi:HlyD family secretion protein [Reinekea marinisedimentorum]|uniref:RND family efflux transporter MFP subunit n=1 Tax=Reinekea marinisedimentorum TaxID=230495 RepID=A0A4R3I7L4_9GAMM|nr:efflux RND transporter periplasmic adaptor subunit [Reinekea marinisedimentorum]TCS42027.1 RND family efflux transporter MFP subunit [Reinekea marinisedimentorum]
MKRDVYAYLTTGVLSVAVGFSAFLVISDNRIPFTTQATIKTNVIEVVPQVQGTIESMLVSEGQKVEKGTPLVQLDKSLYQIALEKAKAQQVSAESQLQRAKSYAERVSSLQGLSGSVSKEAALEAETATRTAEANLRAAIAEVSKAQRDVDKTLVVAEQPGVITNLFYREGMYVSAGSVVVHLVDQQNWWIAADFTEKGISVLTENQQVNIVYDAYPNQVFSGHILSVDPAISSGVTSSSQLAQVSSSTQWIRSQQKIRVRVAADDSPLRIVAGSRASLMVKDNYHISDVWMTILSWFRYLY